MNQKTPTAVVALGGNALSTPSEEDTIAGRFARTRKSLEGVIELVNKGYHRLAITHGNGPQVGNALHRMEMAYPKLPRVPLGVLVADTEGSIGYMIEQSLQNKLKLAGIERQVITIITQVLVDKDDPSLSNPTKYIGQYYSKEEAIKLARQYEWIVKDAGKNGWRRVVGSPHPLKIINGEIIKQLVDSGIIVIASGGGGIPVYLEADGRYEGLDVVIDKDRAAAILARDIQAQVLIILTDTDKVYLNYGKKNQTPLSRINISQAEEYYEQGHFPPGSMGPKIEAAIQFLKNGGEKVIIAHLEQVLDALHGKAGTWIVPK